MQTFDTDMAESRKAVVQADEKKDEKLILCEISGQYFAVNKLPIEFLFFYKKISHFDSCWLFDKAFFIHYLYKFTTLH